METDFEYDVFLSHSSKDKPAVRELAERLKADGLRVWFDEWIIQPGDLIGLKIEEGLEQSRTLVLVMSANAFASEWVTLERHTALFRDPNNAQRRFIPLRLDNAEIKDTLRQYAYIDWRQKSAEQYERLLAACQRQQKAGTTKPVIEPKLKKILKDHTDTVWGVAALPDGRHIVSGSYDKTVRIWNIETWKCLRTFTGHTDFVYQVAVLPDGRHIVSCSDDKTIRLWDAKTGESLFTFEGHTNEVWGVAVTPDGKRIISSSKDRTIRVWQLSP